MARDDQLELGEAPDGDAVAPRGELEQLALLLLTELVYQLPEVPAQPPPDAP